MRTTIMIVAFFLSVTAWAQNDPIPYEWFDEKSKTISAIQYKRQSYTVGDVEAFIAENNFEILFSDKLASVSSRFKEVMVLNSNLWAKTST